MSNTTDSRVPTIKRPQPAPMEYAGKWVAWDRERTQIVAVGEDFAVVRQQAIAAGHRVPWMEVAPQPRAFVG